jgi:hypothetical protein
MKTGDIVRLKGKTQEMTVVSCAYPIKVTYLNNHDIECNEEYSAPELERVYKNGEILMTGEALKPSITVNIYCSSGVDEIKNILSEVLKSSSI